MKFIVASLLITICALSSAQVVKVYPPEPEIVSSKGVVVTVRALSEIDGPRVRLGEIAEIKADAATKTKLEQIDMGPAPAAGIPRPILVSRVQSFLIIAGFKAKDFQIIIPAEAKVALKVQKIDTKQFVEVAKQAVTRQLGVEVPLNCTQTFPEFVAPIGELSLEGASASKNQNGYSVLVTVTVAGKRINSRLINLTVDASVAATAIKSGDAVKILLRNGGATIEVAGKARSAGMLGQQITVIAATGSVHQGVVTGAGQVEVKL